MGDNFSTEEFIKNNIRYFEYIEDKTELMTLGYITYQKLKVAGDGENEMIVFTDGNKWYKTPYTKEMYKIMAQINSSIFEENRIKKFVSENIKTFPIPTQKEFYALGNVIYENLIIARDGNDEYVVFSVGDNFYKIPYAKADKKEDDLYEYLQNLNDIREEEKELKDSITKNLDSFSVITNLQELNDLGTIIYENLTVIEKDGVHYIVFSNKDSWHKLIYDPKILETLKLLNSIRIRELNTKIFIIENIASFPIISTQEQLNALGNIYYRDLQVIGWNEKDWIIFSNGINYFKVPYDRNIKPDALEAYVQINEAKKKAVVFTPSKANTQNSEAR